MEVVLGLLQNCELKAFVINSRELVEWTRVPVLLLYCFDIPEIKDVSAVRHNVVVKRHFVRCIVSEENIISGEKVGERSIKDTKMIRSLFERNCEQKFR